MELDSWLTLPTWSSTSSALHPLPPSIRSAVLPSLRPAPVSRLRHPLRRYGAQGRRPTPQGQGRQEKQSQKLPVEDVPTELVVLVLVEEIHAEALVEAPAPLRGEVPHERRPPTLPMDSFL